MHKYFAFVKRSFALLLALVLLVSSAQFGLTSRASAADTAEERELFAYWVEYEDGLAYESENMVQYGIGSNNPARSYELSFYFGTTENAVRIPVESLTATGRVQIEKLAEQSDNLQNEDDAEYFAFVTGTGFGEGAVVYTYEDVDYTFTFNSFLGQSDFFSQPIYGEEYYIDSFTLTEENNTFYFIYSIARGWHIANIEMDEDFDAIADYEISTCEDGSSCVIFTLTDLPNSGRYYGFYCTIHDSNNNEVDYSWEYIRIYNGVPGLMFRNMDRDSDGNWYENTDYELNNCWDASIDSRHIVKFYYGTFDNCVEVPLDALFATDGIELDYFEENSAFISMETVGFGDSMVIYVDDLGNKHTLPVTVSLPSRGFYSEPQASEKTYLFSEFTVTDENNTCYLVPIDFVLTDAVLRSDLAEIASVELAEDGSYAALTVTGSPENRWYYMTISYTNGDWSNTHDFGLRLINGKPSLMFRNMEWNDENQCWYENTDNNLRTNWNTAPGYNNVVKFYYGTEDNYEAVALDELSVSGDGVTLIDENGFICMEAVAFGSYDIVYVDDSGNKHTMPVTVDLPDLGFYTAPDATQDNYIIENQGFTVTEENNSFYLIPLDGTLNSVTLNDSLAEIASAELADDNSYAIITVTGVPQGRWYNLKASFTRTGNSGSSTWGVGLRINDGTPHLMYRYVEWDSQNQCWYENTDEDFRTNWNTAPGYTSVVKFYYGTEDNRKAVALDELSVSGDGVTLIDENGFICMEAVAFGSYDVIYIDDSGNEHTMPVTVDLPSLAFYTAPDATQDNYIIPRDGFTFTETDQSFYLIPLNGTLNSVTLREEFAEIASYEIADDGSYAIITLTDAPEDRWYDIEASFTQTGSSWTNNWGMSLRLYDGIPHLMYRYMSWDDENQCWYENSDYNLNSVWENSLGYSNVVKFYYGTANDCVAVDLTDLHINCDIITMSTEGDFIRIETNEFGTTEIVYTDANDVEHTMTAAVVLPDVGFYTEPAALMENYINTRNEFSITSENNTLYIVPISGTIESLALSDNFAEIATVTMADDNSFATIEITGIPNDNWYHATVGFTLSGNFYSNVWGIGLRLKDGNPHLMYRYQSWDEENGYWYENPSYPFHTEWYTSPGYSDIVRFYYGTEDNYEAVEFEDLTVSNDCVKLLQEDSVIRMDASSFGSCKILYTDATGTLHTLPVTVDLPGLGLYTMPVASQEYYVNQSVPFAITETNNTLYLVSLNGTLESVELSDNWAQIAQVKIAEDANYATITMDGTPSGDWYHVEAYIVFNGNTHADNWGLGVRLIAGLPNGYEQLYNENADGFTVGQPTGGSSHPNLYVKDASGTLVEIDNTYTMSVSEGLGSIFWSDDGNLIWVSQTAIPYTNGYLYAEKDNVKYAIIANTYGPDACVYTEIPQTGYDTEYYIPADDSGNHCIEYVAGQSKTAYICFGLEGFSFENWTLGDNEAPTSSNENVTVNVINGKVLEIVLADGVYSNVFTEISFWINNGEGETFQYCSNLAFVIDPSIACTVTYDFNLDGLDIGDDDFWGEAEPTIVAIGGTVQLPVRAKDFELAYYVFQGWFTEPTGGEEITNETIINGDMTLYAHWEKRTTVALILYVTEITGVDPETGEEVGDFVDPTTYTITMVDSNGNVVVPEAGTDSREGALIFSNLLATETYTLTINREGYKTYTITNHDDPYGQGWTLTEMGLAYGGVMFSTAGIWEIAEELAAPITKVTNRTSDGKPTISWEAVEGAAGYEVWRCNTKNGSYTKLITITDPNKLSVTHTGAQVGSTYFYKVRAINGDVVGEFSEAKGVWCDLSAPTITVSVNATSGKPFIQWTSVEGATGYMVYRSNTKNGSYVKMYTTTDPNKLSVTHTGAAVGTTYFYKVVAVYGSNSSCNSAMSAAKGVWCDLPAPTITVTTNANTGKPVIKWNKVTGATGYMVYRSSTKNGTYVRMYTTTNPDKLSVTHTGAVVGNTYFYKVVAVYGSNSSCNSAMSAAKGVWCDLAAPTITVTTNSSGKPVISWNKVANATGYWVYRSTDGVNYTRMYTTTNPDKLSVTHTGAVSGTTYYYKVLAVYGTNTSCNSARSAAKSITAK